MERENAERRTPAGKKSAVTVEDHLRNALNATENKTVEYHIHTALQMLVGGNNEE